MNETMNNEKINVPENTNAENASGKRREIIKTVIIVFLAAMLLLTFFSNTIMNKSLAEISTESVSSGRLTERLRGSGMVEANQNYEVKADGNRIVDTIHVRRGQTVKAGDVLFTVGASENAELAEAQTQLEMLELEYEKSLLVVPEDFAAENQAIKNAREDYNTAVAKRDAAVKAETASKNAYAQYSSNKTALSQKINTQAELNAAISSIDADNYTSAPAIYTGNLPSLYGAYSAAKEAYNEAYALYTEAVSNGVDSSSAEANSDEKEAAMLAAQETYNSEKNRIRTNLLSRLAAVDKEISDLSAAVSSYESSMSQGTGMTLADLEADVTAKQRALEDLIIALERAQKESSMTAQLANLDIEAKKAEIERQRARVEALAAKSGTSEIKAEYDGVISSVNVKPGELTVPDAALAEIVISDMGYRVQITVDGNQASKVEAGAEAEVVNNWSGDVKAVLSDIKNDTSGNSQNRILVFDVTGDVDAGAYLDLSIPCGSGNYDAIVPKSAVYEDSGGKFVLTVRSKSSPLGNRYYTEKVSVEVLSSDEVSSAVSGSLSAGDYVITAASKPVSPGEQVRMKD